MDDAIRGLSGEALIRAGGWDPRYARALLVEQDGDHALALIDGNGDGAELELEYWRRDTDGVWHGGASSGHGALNSMPAVQSLNAGDIVAALGRAEPAAEVSVQYDGNVYRRQATESGVWGFVHAADSTRPDEMPTVVAVEPRSK
jgi:hypothetical protein